jgi:hypothetical protein
MTTPPRDDGEAASLSALARSFRHQTIATLVTISNDPSRSDTARTMAARTLMEYDSGRPGNTRPVAVDDVSDLDDDQFERVFHAVMRRIEARQPGFYKTIIQQIVDAMLAKQMAALATPRPNRFKRGPQAQPVPPDPEPTFEPAADAISGDSSADLHAAGGSQPADPTHAFTPRGLGPDRADDFKTPYARSLQAQNRERRRRQDSAPTLNSPPATPPATPQDAAVAGSNRLDLNGHNGNVVALPGVARSEKITAEYRYDPQTRTLVKLGP